MGSDRPPLEPGRKLGRYELKSRLAMGGMAEVWLAEATGISGFHKTVVLKTILPQFAEWRGWRELFGSIPIAAFARPGWSYPALAAAAPPHTVTPAEAGAHCLVAHHRARGRSGSRHSPR